MSDMKTRILVVDDDAALRDLLTGYLEKQGFEVAEAEDGREMDACLARQEADLIILDLMLPGDDGLTLARRLRERSQIPIIMLSARGDEVDRRSGPMIICRSRSIRGSCWRGYVRCCGVLPVRRSRSKAGAFCSGPIAWMC